MPELAAWKHSMLMADFCDEVQLFPFRFLLHLLTYTLIFTYYSIVKSADYTKKKNTLWGGLIIAAIVFGFKTCPSDHGIEELFEVHLPVPVKIHLLYKQRNTHRKNQQNLLHAARI